MLPPEELNAILNRIVKHQQTDTDMKVLRQWLSGGGQIISQQGKYAVNLGQGQEIHIGDIYQGTDAEAIGKIVRSILEELKASDRFATSPEISLPSSQYNQLSVDDLVQQVRSCIHNSIQSLHGTMPLWGIDNWVPLGDLFVDVNILESLSSNRRSELGDLWQDFTTGNSNYRSLDRIGLGKEQQRVSGLVVLERNTNLMVVGKPGSGKTTYLQRIVTECNAGKLQAQRIPVLIKLREFVDDGRRYGYNLDQFLGQLWRLNSTDIELVLNQGLALVLLDGLDEVTGEAAKQIAKEIKRFTRAYPHVQVVVTCRTQSQESRFDRFDYVEVADFNEEQVRAFAEHWFGTVCGDTGQNKARDFLEQLFQEENKPIRELAITPILLSLTCLVFRGKGQFYSKRSKLYEEGLELLLVQWDKSREVERDEVYRDLSVERKLELLSYVAVKKFEQEQYVLFEQEELEGYIGEFLGIERRESQGVLRAIASQHGLLIERSHKVWSFSHLTFQEYLVAKWFVKCADWDKLVMQVTKRYWREVFLLSAEMQINVDSFILLMKRKVDAILACDEKSQNILAWANEKSVLAEDNFCQKVAIRAFYLSIEVLNSFDDHLSRILEPSFNPGIFFSLQVDYLLYRCLFHSLSPDFSISLYTHGSSNLSCIIITRYLDFEMFLGELLKESLDLKPQLREALIKLKNKLPDGQARIKYQQFWNDNSKAWIDELLMSMNNHCQIRHNWQLSNEKQELFQQYYDANNLLLDCLNRFTVDVKEMKQEIEEMLFLPIAEIEKRKLER
jgi:Effector-associated domain 10/NACHT domain